MAVMVKGMKDSDVGGKPAFVVIEENAAVNSHVLSYLCQRLSPLVGKKRCGFRQRRNAAHGTSRDERKVFLCWGRKLFVKGVRYGTFKPASHGSPFPERLVMERDFTLMRGLGANLRTFTVPPRWLLDLAEEYGLPAIIGIPWAEHVAFLDSPRGIREIRHMIADGVAPCPGYVRVGCLVGNEIPPDIAHWHGPEKSARFWAN